MLAPLVTLALLTVPFGHRIVSHSEWRRALRPDTPPTAHEQAHAARSRRRNAAIELAWAGYLAGALLIGLAIHGSF